jgi:uncharacterized membrane protein
MEDRSDSDKYSFLRFVIIATLEVAGMALLIMSGWVFYVAMLSLGLQGGIFSYIAITAFWSFIVLLLIIAATIEWMKKKKKLKD